MIDTTHATGYAVGCPDWQTATRKMNDCAKQTGYTTSIVNRGGDIIITIDPRYGDRVLARQNGRLGMYTA